MTRRGDRRVAVEDGFDGQLADARPTKELLGDDRAADEHAEIETDHRYQRQESVAKRVSNGDAHWAHPFGARRAHEVLPQDVDHVAAHEPRVVRGAGDPQRERR